MHNSIYYAGILGGAASHPSSQQGGMAGWGAAGRARAVCNDAASTMPDCLLSANWLDLATCA